MTGHHALDQAILEIRDRHKIDIMPDADGTTTLQLSENVICTLEVPPGSECIFLHAPIERAPREDREELFAYLLQANVFGLPLPCSWIGLDASSDEFLLCSALPLQGITSLQLEAMMSSYLVRIPEIRVALRGDADEDGRAFDAPPQPESDLHVGRVLRG